MNEKTKGELEAEFTNAIVRFEKEYLGRGPVEARSYLIDDMILVRLQGVLTPAEEILVKNKDGRELVKEARRQLFETSKPIIEEYVREIFGRQLVGFYSDISTTSGERIIVLTVNEKFLF